MLHSNLLSTLEAICTNHTALELDSLTAEPQGKPKNTGVGSLFLLQGIFPTQELNNWIFYQLSYQGGQAYSNPPAILQVNVYFTKAHAHF